MNKKLYREEMKESVILKMKEIADKIVKSYRTDLDYDIDEINQGKDRLYLWALRETGTHLAAIKDGWHDTACYNSIDGMNNHFYIIDIYAGTITKLSRENALAL